MQKGDILQGCGISPFLKGISIIADLDPLALFDRGGCGRTLGGIVNAALACRFVKREQKAMGGQSGLTADLQLLLAAAGAAIFLLWKKKQEKKSAVVA